jgi:hypothetical protein
LCESLIRSYQIIAYCSCFETYTAIRPLKHFCGKYLKQHCSQHIHASRRLNAFCDILKFWFPSFPGEWSLCMGFHNLFCWWHSIRYNVPAPPVDTGLLAAHGTAYRHDVAYFRGYSSPPGDTCHRARIHCPSPHVAHAAHHRSALCYARAETPCDAPRCSTLLRPTTTVHSNTYLSFN